MSKNKLDNCQKLLTKLDSQLQDKKYYEAHQLYKIIYFRYITQLKYAEAINLLTDGAIKLIDNGEIQSGYDLGMLFLDMLKKKYVQLSLEIINRIVLIFKSLPHGTLERTQFQCTSLDIIRQLSQNDLLFELHSKFGQVLWDEKDYPQARYHYIRSGDGEGCATMLVEYSTTHGYPSETDLFIAQAVFQYLCLQNQSTASIAFNCYVKRHPNVEKGDPPFPLPLLNFLCFLLLAIQNKAKLAVFAILCEKYEASLKRDPTFYMYLDRIGQIFFGLTPQRSSDSMGILDNLLQTFMNFQPQQTNAENRPNDLSDYLEEDVE